MADLAVVAAARVAAVYAFRAPITPEGAAHGGEGAGTGDDVGGADLGERVLAAVLGGLPDLVGCRRAGPDITGTCRLLSTGHVQPVARLGRPSA